MSLAIDGVSKNLERINARLGWILSMSIGALAVVLARHL
jgi:hypothetical protein